MAPRRKRSPARFLGQRRDVLNRSASSQEVARRVGAGDGHDCGRRRPGRPCPGQPGAAAPRASRLRPGGGAAGRRSRSSTSAGTTGRAWRTCRSASASPSPGSTTTCRARKSCSGWRSTGRSTGCGRRPSARVPWTTRRSSGSRRSSATRSAVLVARLPYVTLCCGSGQYRRRAGGARPGRSLTGWSRAWSRRRNGTATSGRHCPRLTARLLFGTVNSIVEWYRPDCAARHSRWRTRCPPIAFDGCGCEGSRGSLGGF